jgi:hypothetical protein
MSHPGRGIAGAVLVGGVLLPALVVAETKPGPYARIAVLRPHDGKTVEFEAGYIRHLAWHEQAKDPFAWYGWSVTFGERQRFFVYATFGHAVANFDAAVAPAEDERDNILNVTPHAEFVGNALFEFLPALSRGTGTPQPAPRLELVTVDLHPGSAAAFESALGAGQAGSKDETLWYRMVAGGPSPRYVRLRPRPSLATVAEARGEPAFAEAASRLVEKMTVEILTLRPTMSYGIGSPARP